MCGRYIFAQESKVLYKRYDVPIDLVSEHVAAGPMYNISPGSLVSVITKNSPNSIEIMKWGFIPHWARDPRIGSRLINARAETLAQKSSFKHSFEERRCLVPATGFYEWMQEGNDKVPYLIQLRDKDIFSFAGLYDIWQDVEGKQFKTFCIITTEANKLMRSIHLRMPAILSRNEEKTWLNPQNSPDKLQKLLKPYEHSRMEAYPVSNKVNNPRNQGEELIKKA